MCMPKKSCNGKSCQTRDCYTNQKMSLLFNTTLHYLLMMSQYSFAQTTCKEFYLTQQKWKKVGKYYLKSTSDFLIIRRYTEKQEFIRNTYLISTKVKPQTNRRKWSEKKSEYLQTFIYSTVITTVLVNSRVCHLIFVFIYKKLHTKYTVDYICFFVKSQRS